jgi:hypothetical protein
MACDVSVLADSLADDQWWSQDGLLKSDEVYREELRGTGKLKYWMT